MASSTDEQLHLPTPDGTTSAPPPTPSASQPNDQTSDALSRLLHRLPPTLSLSFPTRRHASPPTTAISPPLISLSEPKPTLHSNLLSAATQRGFFQLTHHSIPSQLPHSSESESSSLFNLSRDEKHLYFPKNWPLGFDFEDEDEENSTTGESFCIDSSCSAELSLCSLREFTGEMEKLGLKVVEELACAVGFENPVGEDRTRVCSLMWISQSCSSECVVSSGRLYPFVLGLHYQLRCQKYSMLADSGWVSVSPQAESVLVTLGDIAQVWSNGKVKKVRGRPIPTSSDHLQETNSSSNARSLSMTLLVTLPLGSTVSPLLPKSPSLAASSDDGDETTVLNKENDGLGDENSKPLEQESPMFNSFSFEDYAWRVYHERLLLKDPLVRYRV